VVKLFDYFKAKRPKLQLQHKVAVCSILGFARNALASAAFADSNVSHLLMIDPDMSVPPEVVIAMLDFDQPVVAAPYPNRDWNRQAFADAVRKIDDIVVAEACAVTYVGGDDDLVMSQGPDGKPKPITRGPFARVKSCGAGVILVKRGALELMAAKRPDLVINEARGDYERMGFKGNRIIECFEYSSNLTSDQAAEGAGFAKAWIEDCGGEIWTYMDATIMRYAEHRFVGHYASKLKLGMM
jgi:hypothetical protein